MIKELQRRLQVKEYNIEEYLDNINCFLKFTAIIYIDIVVITNKVKHTVALNHILVCIDIIISR